MEELISDKEQHIIADKTVINKFAEAANLTKKDRVIEIGAGIGNITEELIKRAGEVLAFEVEGRFDQELENLEKNNKNLEVIFGNALNYPWKGYKIVANIPFSISDEVIIKAVLERVEELVLIVGDHFRTILEEKESKIGFIASLFFDAENLFKISGEAFKPIPHTSGWAVRLRRRKEKNQVERILRGIITKNGKIKNSIIYSISNEGKTKNEAREILKKLEMDQETLDKPVAKITGKFLIRLKNELSKLNF